MRIIYNIIHFIVICVLAPWLLGAGYAICSSKFDAVMVVGNSLVVFSFPITFFLAVVSWIVLRICDGEINPKLSRLAGVVVGVVMGLWLTHIFGGGNDYFVFLSGVIGGFVGHVEVILFGPHGRGLDQRE